MYTTSFPIQLVPTGDDGAGLRLQNTPGQLQRQHIIQNDSSGLTVHSDLISVRHGAFSPSGDPATLVLIEFRFVGSRSEDRRFREATITVQFVRGKNSVDSEDPIVVQIAPDGAFAMNPSVEQLETTVCAAAEAGVSLGPATIGVGVGFERTSSLTREMRATLEGAKRIEGRTSGPQNAAKWILRENPAKKDGIPGSLRTAILIKPETTGQFEAWVSVKARVDWKHPIKQLFGNRVVDPVFFGEESERRSMGADIEGLDVENMSACKLDEIGVVVVSTLSLVIIRL